MVPQATPKEALSEECTSPYRGLIPGDFLPAERDLAGGIADLWLVRLSRHAAWL